MANIVTRVFSPQGGKERTLGTWLLWDYVVVTSVMIQSSFFQLDEISRVKRFKVKPFITLLC